MAPRLSFMGRKVALLELIAEGGYSFVYSAVDQNQTEYVVKKQHCQSPEAVARVRQEVELMEACKDVPGVVRVLGSIEVPRENSREWYMLLEKVQGGTLIDLLKDRTLSDNTVVDLTLQLARTLA
jgi:serine/threonine protein kinase